jgi:hydrogenase/urease accessory protein HupE
MKWRAGRWSMAAVFVLFGAGAGAHEARPVAVHIVEQDDGLYAVDVRSPTSIDADNHPYLAWPADCRTVAAQLVRCARSMAGRTVTVSWPIYNPSVTTLLRYQTREGATHTAVMPPTETSWTIPARPTASGVIGSYFKLGVQHILGGPDHLLFVAGLLLIAGSLRRIVLAVSGFTLAHSLTLSLAALGFIHVPIPPTEAAIALSILFLAREALLNDGKSVVFRYPVVVSATFGLLHGLGFAAALGEVGLPDREIPWALLFFNVGVEAGQLSFILVVTGAVVLGRRMLATGRAAAWLDRYGRVAASYVIGVPAAFWLVQRL